MSGRDYDGLEAGLRALKQHWSWRESGRRTTTFGELTRDAVRARRDRAKSNLDAFVAETDADLAPLLHDALQVPSAEYEQLKTRAGRLDFLDLLISARDLIRDNAAVRNELQQRYTHFFIDEFQDTDPLQVEILLLLAADDPAAADWRTARPVPGKLFLVGDPKQSIYRFRRADIALYEAVKARLIEAGAELLHLTTSFRAPPSIQSFVNAAFSRAMTAKPDRGQAGYVPLEKSRPDIAGRPTLVALPVPRPYSDYGRFAKYRIDESFPPAVCAFAHWLIDESGWTVEEDGVPTRIRPRHIAILFRRFRSFGRDVTRAYVRALEARRIPHVLVGGRSFHECEEIIALRAALTAIEWPDDELSVFATLRGPFFALSDEALLLFRQGAGPDGSPKVRRLNPMRRIDRAVIPPAAAEVADALEVLRDLHIGRNRRPIAQTITMLLDSVRAHAGIALWPTGEQALANAQRLVDMARQFERSASSFRAFVNKLEIDAKHGEADEAPIVEEGTEGVRLMTVHKAKGLQFPVVILADPSHLILEVDEPLPLRHQQILEAGSEGAAASEANYAAWLQEGETLRDGAAAPSLTVKTVTSVARSATHSPETALTGEAIEEAEGQPASAYPKVRAEIIARSEQARPRGRRFGALVHVMLATIELDADEAAIQASAALQQRMFDATQKEIEAAVVTVATALRHPLLRAAARVGRANIRRETPVLLTLEDGTLAEGVLDLAFREHAGGFNGWTVIDFKTDYEFTASSAQYLAQVRLYARAIEAATALPALGILLVL